MSRQITIPAADGLFEARVSLSDPRVELKKSIRDEMQNST
jgi:hypothetical protein